MPQQAKIDPYCSLLEAADGTVPPVWLWRPYVEAETGATAAELQSEGWETFNKIKHPALAEILLSQLAPIRVVRIGKTAEVYARHVDISLAHTYPVVLGSSITIPPGLFTIPPRLVHFEQSVPPLSHGCFGMVVRRASVVEWDVIGYNTSVSEDITDLQKRLSAHLDTMAAPAGHHATDAFAALRKDGYEAIYKRMPDDEHRAGVDQLLTLDVNIQAQRARIQADPDGWRQQWEEAHTLAQELAKAYHRFDQQKREVRNVPHTRNVFRLHQAKLPSHLPIFAVASAIATGKSGAGWEEDPESGRPVRRHHSDGWEVQTVGMDDELVQLAKETPAIGMPDNAQILVDNATVQSVWANVRKLDDLAMTVFLILVAQETGTQADMPDGSRWITGKAILEYRGIKPMMRTDTPGGPKREAGHRTEDMQQISDVMRLLTGIWVDLRPLKDLPFQRKGARGRRTYWLRGPVLSVVQKITLRETLPPEEREQAANIDVAWRFSMGGWMQELLGQYASPMTAVLAQKVIEYDPYRRSWEKRLGTYLVLHLRIAAGHGAASIIRTIGPVLKELGLEIEKENPQRSRNRFEEALDRLKDDKVIWDWRYEHGVPKVPPRDWVQTWLDQSIRIETPPATLTEYAGLIAKASHRTKEEVLAEIRSFVEADDDEPSPGGKK